MCILITFAVQFIEAFQTNRCIQNITGTKNTWHLMRSNKNEIRNWSRVNFEFVIFFFLLDYIVFFFCSGLLIDEFDGVWRLKNLNSLSIGHQRDPSFNRHSAKSNEKNNFSWGTSRDGISRNHCKGLLDKLNLQICVLRVFFSRYWWERFFGFDV